MFLVFPISFSKLHGQKKFCEYTFVYYHNKTVILGISILGTLAKFDFFFVVSIFLFFIQFYPKLHIVNEKDGYWWIINKNLKVIPIFG